MEGTGEGNLVSPPTVGRLADDMDGSSSSDDEDEDPNNKKVVSPRDPVVLTPVKKGRTAPAEAAAVGQSRSPGNQP